MDENYETIFRMSFRKADGTIVRSTNGKPFPIKIRKDENKNKG